MFRDMRRKKQLLPPEESLLILENGTSGVLAVAGDDGYPYTVPLSYVYHDSKIYFHAAKSGHKIDAVRNCSKASFCVIGQDQIVPEKYTSLYRSVVAFGKIRILEDDAEKRDAIEKLAVRYNPDADASEIDEAIRKDWEPLCMLEFTIEHMTGKEGSELAAARRKGAI